jgi:hypothetical protein
MKLYKFKWIEEMHYTNGRVVSLNEMSGIIFAENREEAERKLYIKIHDVDNVVRTIYLKEIDAIGFYGDYSIPFIAIKDNKILNESNEFYDER